MAKPRKNSAAAANNNSSSNTGDLTPRAKPKRTRKSVPRESPTQRSSVYRGVTRFVLYCIAMASHTQQLAAETSESSVTDQSSLGRPACSLLLLVN